ncbi:hypothetical protein BDQ17DRAFT_1333558, partial [Cyathus striatus]
LDGNKSINLMDLDPLEYINEEVGDGTKEIQLAQTDKLDGTNTIVPMDLDALPSGSGQQKLGPWSSGAEVPPIIDWNGFRIRPQVTDESAFQPPNPAPKFYWPNIFNRPSKVPTPADDAIPSQQPNTAPINDTTVNQPPNPAPSKSTAAAKQSNPAPAQIATAVEKPNVQNDPGTTPPLNIGNVVTAISHQFNTFREDQKRYNDNSASELKKQKEKEYESFKALLLQEQKKTAHIISDTIECGSVPGESLSSSRMPCSDHISNSASSGTGSRRKIIHTKEQVPLKNDPRRSFFLEAIRTHIKHLLGMKKDQIYDAELFDRFAPLTDEELQKYNDRDIGFPPIKANDLRIDFSKTITIPFNIEAADVVVEDFLEAAKCSLYMYYGEQFPDDFLEWDVILQAVQSHLQYIYGIYKEFRSDDPALAALERLKKTSHAS